MLFYILCGCESSAPNPIVNCWRLSGRCCGKYLGPKRDGVTELTGLGGGEVVKQ